MANVIGRGLGPWRSTNGEGDGNREGDLYGERKRPTKTGGYAHFLLSMYCIQHCFICRPSESTVSEDAGIEPRAFATSALAVRRSNHG
jgi:hypothetical protein